MYITLIMVLSVGLGGAGVLAGLVCLVVGVAKRRKTMWCGALVFTVISLAVFVSGVVWGTQAAAWAGKRAIAQGEQAGSNTGRKALTRMAEAVIEPAAEELGHIMVEGSAGSDENMRRWFKEATGQDLPKEAQYVAGEDYFPWLSAIYMKVRVPAEFKDTLDARFQPANETTGNMQPHSATAKDVLEDMPSWNDDVSKAGVIFYTVHTGDIDHGGWDTSLALDTKSQTLYCVLMAYAP